MHVFDHCTAQLLVSNICEASRLTDVHVRRSALASQSFWRASPSARIRGSCSGTLASQSFWRASPSATCCGSCHCHCCGCHCHCCGRCSCHCSCHCSDPLPLLCRPHFPFFFGFWMMWEGRPGGCEFVTSSISSVLTWLSSVGGPPCRMCCSWPLRKFFLCFLPRMCSCH